MSPIAAGPWVPCPEAADSCKHAFWPAADAASNPRPVAFLWPAGTHKNNHLTRPMTLQEEACRYALLRRITPALRHHMAGEFQPIGMMAALLERRSQHASPDLASLRDNCSALGTLSRKAANACGELMVWLAPPPLASQNASEGLNECVSLLSTSLRFNGIALSSQAPELDAQVSTSALRNVLTATILVLSDAAAQPANLQVSASEQGTQVLMELSLAPMASPADMHSGQDYRALSWDDLLALAEAEAVGLTRTAQGARLTFAVLSNP